MNTPSSRRRIFSVAVALALAGLACSPLSSISPVTKTATPPPAATKAPAATSAPSGNNTPAPGVTSASSATTAAGAPTSASVDTEAPADTQAPADTEAPATEDSALANATVPAQLTASAATAAASGGSLLQWAATVTASTQYGDDSWAAFQAANAPDTPNTCADQITAWASASANDQEWLELTYTTTVVPTAVNIYETYGVGSITKVDVEEPNGTPHTVFTSEPLRSPVCPRTTAIGISGVTSKVNKVKIYFDMSEIGIWDEVDAVQLVGNP